MAEKLEAAVLDWAGTTLDYGCEAPAKAFQESFEYMGVPITMLEARKPMGKHKKVHIAEILKDESVAQRWLAAHKRAPTEADVEKIFEVFQPIQMPLLVKYSALISGTLEAVEECRKMGLKIGSTTGYTGEMMKLLMAEAEKQGYLPDATVCATGHYAVRNKIPLDLNNPFLGYGKDISRPKPHMCNLNAMLLDVSDNAAVVKVGDTLDDIREGKRAGMWTIGLAGTGNEMYLTEEHEGLTEEQVREKDPLEYKKKLIAAYRSMAKESPDYLVDSIRDVPKMIENINIDLKRGRRPGERGTLMYSNRCNIFL